MEKLKIATANNRYCKAWKNVRISWSDFIKRLKIPVTTSETQGEYRNMTKSEQDNIKDVGCYVCGYLKEGKRRNESLAYRSMITLDADFAGINFVEDTSILFEYDYIIHSTKKSTKDKPRYRLIAPLSRNCNADEYEAVARYIAGYLGIEQFDDTTYQASRLMYYPSISQNQEYEFYAENKNAPVEVDKILKKYDNWEDRTTWATSERTSTQLKRDIRKQQNPLEKDGLIGAFCNVYDIETAIDTFLPSEYTKEDNSNRYTYTKGSTFGGAVVYDDFLYSNHGTDPASGKLCNAFDLVRIHKFSELDEEVKENTPANKLPSFVAMSEFVSKDKEVKKYLYTLKKEKLKEDFKDFQYSDDENEEDNGDWLEKLETDRKGKPFPTIANICLILENDPKLKNRFAYNDMSKNVDLTSKTFWRKDISKPRIIDGDVNFLIEYFENLYKIYQKEKTQIALANTSYRHKFHPIKDYLKNLEWDGVERVETLFIEFLGAEDNRYTREVTKRTLLGAVHRIFDPGCKFDTVLTLVGGQGLGKSTMVKRLGVKWSTELKTFTGKEAIEQMLGFWILEVAELEALSKAKRETAKSFITTTEDTFRPAYASKTETHPRQSIFIATTNNHDFLTDNTGNRRWLPLDCGIIKPLKHPVSEFKSELVKQVWAEIMEMYRSKKVKIYLDDPGLIKMAEEEQRKHLAISPLQGVIEEYLNTKVPENWDKMTPQDKKRYLREYENGNVEPDENTHLIHKTCIVEIWEIVLDGVKKDLDRKRSIEIKDCILKIQGWGQHRTTVRFNTYGIQKGFTRTVY